jgi:hypothetical protein
VNKTNKNRGAAKPGWIVALLCIVLIGIMIYFVVGQEEDPQVEPTPESEIAKAAKEDPRSGKAGRMKLPRWKKVVLQDTKTGKKPEVAELDQESEIKSLSVDFTMPDGSTGVIYPERPTFHKNKMVKLYMRLKDPNGEPLAGRKATTITFINSKTGEIFNWGFTERIYREKGFYEAVVPKKKIFETPGEIDVIVHVPHTDLLDVKDPESSKRTQVKMKIPVGIPVQIAGAVGQYTDTGLMVQVIARGDYRGPIFVAGELLQLISPDNYEPIMAASSGQKGDVTDMNVVVLDFPGIAASETAEYYLGDLTMWYGDNYDLADFKQFPVKIGFPQQQAQ